MSDTPEAPVPAKFQLLADSVDLFKGLTAHDVQVIFTKGMTLRVAQGDTVFHKNTTGNQMYVVLAGKVGVFDGPKMVAELGVGESFGEMSLLAHEPRSATVIALEMSNLFVLSEDIFQRLLTKRVAVQILLNLASSLGRKVKNMNLKLRESEGR